MAPIAASPGPNGHFNNFAGPYSRNCLANLPRTEANLGPSRGKQNDDADLPSCKILLVAKILIGRCQNLVSLSLRQVEQLAIALVGPAFLCRRIHGMLRKAVAQRSGRALIE